MQGMPESVDVDFGRGDRKRKGSPCRPRPLGLTGMMRDQIGLTHNP